VVQGRLFGMVQGKANQWIHVLVLVQPVKTGITPPLAIPSCGQEGEKGRLRRAERLHERQ
jgi:hypothetical protein